MASEVEDQVYRPQHAIEICSTGFVSLDAGSVASANAMILAELVSSGLKIDFFAKPTFVDPRICVENSANRHLLSLVDCTNHFADNLRQRLAPRGRGLWGWLLGKVDAVTYNRLLVKRMRSSACGNIDVWLGDWARGKGSRPVLSYAQGPPGTDARSVFKHFPLIATLAGKGFALKLRLFAQYRLSMGLPNFGRNDRIIVGSQWSRSCLHNVFGVNPEKTTAIPYPIDLNLFHSNEKKKSTNGPLKLLWLGRFAPRKRLDLFLDGLVLAARNGVDVTATVVGKSDFVPNYEKLLSEFPFPERLTYLSGVARHEVPSLMESHDAICQPSDEENFGSSVAEALACGLPAIVGATNGTADYLCSRSVVLKDDNPHTLAAAISQMHKAKRSGELSDIEPSRKVAEHYFAPAIVAEQLIQVLIDVIHRDNSVSAHYV